MKSLVLSVLMAGLIVLAANWPAAADSNDQTPMKATENTLDGPTAVPAPTPLHAAESSLNGSVSEQAKRDNPTLHGGAYKTGAISVPIQHFKMNAQQLRAAAAQYENDVRTFYSEVQRYDAMLKDFNFVRGQCNENETAYQAKVRQDQLNLKTLVIPTSISAQPPPPPPAPTVEPPKVCCARCLASGRCGPHLGTGGGGGGAMPAPGSSRINAMREADAQRELSRNGQILKNLEEEGQFLGQKAINQAEIETRQQQLVAQFEKLQDHYKMLKVEKDTLVNSSTGR